MTVTNASIPVAAASAKNLTGSTNNSKKNAIPPPNVMCKTICASKRKRNPRYGGILFAYGGIRKNDVLFAWFGKKLENHNRRRY